MIREEKQYWGERLAESVQKYRRVVKEWRKQRKDDPTMEKPPPKPPPCPVIAWVEVIEEACKLAIKELQEEAKLTSLGVGELRAAQRHKGTGDITVCATYYKRPEDFRRFSKSVPSHLRMLVEDTRGNLSAARNRLMQRCPTEFAFLCEEDMEWHHDTDLWRLRDVLLYDPDVVFAACRVMDGRNQWHHNFRRERVGETIFLHADVARSDWKATANGTLYQRCDLVKNAGLIRTGFAKTHLWDESLELSEHRDWFLRMAESGYRAAYVPQVSILHHNTRPTNSYISDRKRSAKFFLAVESKHGIKLREPEVTRDTVLPNIVVLGVGYSNTSITAFQIKEMGWNVGDIDEEFCEHRKVRQVNENFMKSGHWDTREAELALANLNSPWLIKDPRFRVTLRKWYPVFAQYKPLLLHLTKDSKLIADSWSRHGMNASQLPNAIAACDTYFEEWPWPKMKLDASDIAKAVCLYSLDRTASHA